MAGIENYKTGEKNNWRRRTWNEIAKRVKNPKQSTVMYLAAEQDLDRRVAIERGFSPNNLISVDMRQSVVGLHRDSGKVAIHGKLSEVVAQYGGVDVLLADYCCGLTQEVADCFQAAVVGGGLNKNGVAVFNIQRGREAGMDWLYIDEIQQGMLRLNGVSMKHRGSLLWHRFVLEGYEKSGAGYSFQYYQDTLKNLMRPSTTTYTSSANKGLKFDTLVFTYPWEFPQAERKKWTNRYIERKCLEKNRGIAAAKAVATMRAKGFLKAQPGR